MRLSRLLPVLTLALAGAAQAADCGALLRQHLAGDMALSFDAFDQDDHQGWRMLGDAGCEAEAAALIEAYAARQAHPPQVLTCTARRCWPRRARRPTRSPPRA